MGLESKAINSNSKLYSSGKIKIYDVTVNDHSSLTKGNRPLDDVIAYSGNVAMVEIGRKIESKEDEKTLVAIILLFYFPFVLILFP